MIPPTRDQIRAFLLRLVALVQAEAIADATESSLLFSNCSVKLLELKGLALSGLSVSKTSIGLGGKTLIELERSLAYHAAALFPPHSFRPGDIVSVVNHAATRAGSQKVKRDKDKDNEDSKELEGVVYKVSDLKVVIAIGKGGTSGGAEPEGRKGEKGTAIDELDLPERVRM